jgi:hypothetical protein
MRALYPALALGAAQAGARVGLPLLVAAAPQTRTARTTQPGRRIRRMMAERSGDQ